MSVPAKNPPGGRPKRNRILAETAFRMRSKGSPLREIQSFLNAQGVMQLGDCGPEERPYFRAARRWADSGAETLGQFRAAEGRELVDLAMHRALEAADLLLKIVAGQVPLIDAGGRVIPTRGETEEQAALRASRLTLPLGGRVPKLGLGPVAQAPQPRGLREAAERQSVLVPGRDR